MNIPDYDPVPSRQSRRTLGFLAAAVLVIITLMSGVYFAFTYIRTQVEAVPNTLPLATIESVYNKIAFVGNDSNMWLIGPDGNDLRQLTGDGQNYRFPTWAPDGSRLAFIGRDDLNRSALFVSPTSHSQPQVIFSNGSSAPFYLYWAPNSQHITFLTQEIDNLSMRMVDVTQPASQRVLGNGAPFYWVWSPQSDQMLMHVGGSRAFSDEAHISLLDNNLNAERVELTHLPGRFQAPAWSSDGQHIYFVAADASGQEAIYRAESDSLAHKRLAPLNNFANFVLSPDNHGLAFLQFEPGDTPPFGRAYLMTAAGDTPQLLTNSPVASMYWSPDGQKLALLSLSRPTDGPTAANSAGGLASPLPQPLKLRWWVYTLADETLTPLVSFEPTLNFLQTVPYFDQYHLSLTFWSPDSRYLVVTKRESERDNNGSVWVVDTTGQEAPRQIGDGTLAVWSWQ